MHPTKVDRSRLKNLTDLPNIGKSLGSGSGAVGLSATERPDWCRSIADVSRALFENRRASRSLCD